MTNEITSKRKNIRKRLKDLKKTGSTRWFVENNSVYKKSEDSVQKIVSISRVKNMEKLLMTDKNLKAFK